MQFHAKKVDLFDLTSFFAWTFFSFLARCVSAISREKKIVCENIIFFVKSNIFNFHIPNPGIFVCFAAPPPFLDNVCKLFPPPGTEIKSGSSKSESSSSSSGFLFAPDFFIGLGSGASSSGSVSKSSSKLRV